MGKSTDSAIVFRNVWQWRIRGLSLILLVLIIWISYSSFYKNGEDNTNRKLIVQKFPSSVSAVAEKPQISITNLKLVIVDWFLQLLRKAYNIIIGFIRKYVMRSNGYEKLPDASSPIEKTPVGKISVEKSSVEVPLDVESELEQLKLTEEEEAVKRLADELNTTDNDPCDDFHKFVCPDKIRYNDRLLSNDEVHLMRTLQRPPLENQPQSFPLIQSFFKSCYDLKTIRTTIKSVLHDIFTKLGGWPLLEGAEWNAKNFDWIQTISTLRDLHLSSKSFFSYTDAGKDKNAQLRAPNRFYISNIGVMEKIAMDFGISKAILSKEMQPIDEFKTRLQKLRNKVETTHPSERPITLSLNDLKAKIHDIKWDEIFKNTHEDADIDIHGIHYFEALGELIKTTDKKTVANYMFLNAFERYAYDLNMILQNPSDTDLEDRLIFCTNKVAKCFPLFKKSFYAREYYTKSVESSLENIFKNLQYRFIEMVNQFQWMDESTWNDSKVEINKVSLDLNYRDLVNNDDLDKYYKDFKRLEGAYFESLLKPINLLHSDGIPPEIYSDIKLESNALILPYTFIEEPYYYKGKDYANYARIGTLMGEQLGRVIFGDASSAADWWSQFTKDEYSKFSGSIKEATGSDIYQLIGLKMAYLAYQEILKANNYPQESGIAGLKYTAHEQLFFIAYERLSCKLKSTGTQVKYLSNYVAKSFNCKPDSNLAKLNIGFIV